MRSLWILGYLFLLVSCASGGKFDFQSTPTRADVYVKPIKGGEFKKIGTTPFVINSSKINKENANSGPIYIELRKSGYKSERILITEMSGVNLTITRELQRKSGLDDQKSINDVIDMMFEVKSLVQANQYDKALKLIDVLKSMVPQVSTVYELEGGIYFIQKDYAKALGSYRLAARYNPKNPENIRMRDLLEDWFKKEGNSL